MVFYRFLQKWNSSQLVKKDWTRVTNLSQGTWGFPGCSTESSMSCSNWDNWSPCLYSLLL